MSLDLGAVVGRVVLEDVQFQRTYVRVVRQMGELGAEAGKAGAGTDVLDRGLARVGAAGTTAATGLGRATKATTENATASQRDAAAAARLAAATTRVNEAMAASAGSSARRRVLTLQQIAADERLVASSAAVGSSEARQAAQTAKLAAAQASAIGAGERLAASQTKWAAKASAAGATMTRKLTLPIVAAAGVAIDQAMKFDAATNVYVTAAGESEKNLAVIRNGIKQTAVETGTSIKNLTDAEYLVEKAGLRGADGLLVLNAAAKGAREENAQLSDVVQAETSVMASYHLPASKAVQVMNALKTGAGQAKVTMEEYAGSLSTVIPIASANHIALEQVLGSLSTLTQHGTTAKEATQELASTIRALVAPNRVAMNEMQQLGLSVNDVTKNIGKRGLTGTVDLLVNAITSHMGPAGLVIQKSMNQSKSAMADVNVMLQQMPANVKKLATEYVAGKISLGDWRTELKKLPADQAALAKQFQSLTDRAHGFSQLLKSGDPAAQTFVSSLRKLSGGAIGLNTILQLSGENLTGFKTRTDDVGKSLHDNAKEVEGWESTSKLAATRTSQFKEQLHVLAINGGAELLPMFTGLVQHLSSAVSWIGHLSHTQKEMLGWSLGVLAALGPLMGIGGRLALVGSGIGTFVAGTTARLATLAGFSEATALRISVAMRGVTSALAGVGIGFAIGSLTKNSSDATKAVGALTAAGVGAAVGFGVGGPLGAAIGGITGGLASLATGFFNSGDAAKRSAQVAQAALAAEKQTVDDLASAIAADNEALGANTRAQIANNLEHSGALDLARQNGISLKTLTDAALGNVGATNQITAALFKASQGGTLLTSTQTDLVAALSKAGIDLRSAALQADRVAEANGKLNLSTRSVAQQFAMYGTSLDSTNKYGQENVAFIQAHVTALGKEYTAGKLTTSQYGAQILALQQQATQYSHNSARVSDLIAQFAQIPPSVITKLLADPKIAKSAIGDVLRTLAKQPASKSTTLKAVDRASAPTTNILDLYRKVPGGKTSVISVVDQASGKLLTILGYLSSIDGKTVVINTVNTVSGGGLNVQGGAGRQARAGGGPVHDGWFTVGEEGGARGWELGRKQGSKVDFYSNAQSRAMTGWNHVPGFAGGTSGSSLSTTMLDTRLITAVHQLQSGITVSLRSVAASMRFMASRAAATVNAAIRAAVAPAPSQAAMVRALPGQVAAARTKAAEADIALANYRKLEAAAKAYGNSTSKQAEAARKLADRAKAAYDQMAQAAQDSAAKAADAAKSLVDSIQSSVDAMQSKISDFKSSVSAGIAGDHSLATLWGNSTSALSDAANSLTSAQQAVDDASAEGASSASSLASAQQAAAVATDQLTAAHQALAAAQAAVIAGTASPQQYALLTSAQQAQTDAVARLAAANTALQAAQQAVGNTAGPTADQLKALTDAQNAYNAAVAANTVAGLQANLNQILASTQTFASDLQAVAKAGGNQDLIAQLAGMGTTAGDALAKQLLAAGPKAITSLQTSMAAIDKVAGTAANKLAKTFYGAGASAMDSLILGLMKKMPALDAALAPILAEVNKLFGPTTTHTLEQAHTVGWLAANYHETVAQLLAANPGLKGDTATSTVAKGTKLTVPAFANGVENFGGGIAMVHRGEALVNFTRPGSSVIPANRVKNIFDDTRIVGELRSMNDRIDGLAAAIGHEVSTSGAELYQRAGEAQGRHLVRAGRKGL